MKKILKNFLLSIMLIFVFVFSFVVINKESVNVSATEYISENSVVEWDKTNTKYYTNSAFGMSKSDIKTIEYSSMSNWNGNSTFYVGDSESHVSIRTYSPDTAHDDSMAIFIPLTVNLNNLPGYGYMDNVKVNFNFKYYDQASEIIGVSVDNPTYGLEIVDLNDLTLSKLSFSQNFDINDRLSSTYVLQDDQSISSKELSKIIASTSSLKESTKVYTHSCSNLSNDSKDVISSTNLCKVGLYIYSKGQIANHLSFDLDINVSYTEGGKYVAKNKNSNTFYRTVSDGITALEGNTDNEVLKIISDVTDCENLVVSKDLRIEFWYEDGKYDNFDVPTISFKDNCNLKILSDASLYIDWGNIEGNCEKLIDCYGTFTCLRLKLVNNSTSTTSCSLYTEESGYVTFSGSIDSKIGVISYGITKLFYDDDPMAVSYERPIYCEYKGDGYGVILENGRVSFIGDVCDFDTVKMNCNNKTQIWATDEYLYTGEPIIVECYGSNFNNENDPLVYDLPNGYSDNFVLKTPEYKDGLLTPEYYEIGLFEDEGRYRYIYGLRLVPEKYELVCLDDSSTASVSCEYNNAGCDLKLKATPKYGYNYPIEISGYFTDNPLDIINYTFTDSEDVLIIEASKVTSNFNYSVESELVSIMVDYHTDKDTTNLNQTTFNLNTPSYTLIDAEKSGFDFDGWYLDSTFNKPITKLVLDYSSTNDLSTINLYPKFIKSSVSEFQNLSTLASLLTEYNVPDSIVVEQNFYDEDFQKDFTTQNPDYINLIPYGYNNYGGYCPTPDQFGLYWPSNSLLSIEALNGWTIRRVDVHYSDWSYKFSDPCGKYFSKHGEYEHMYYNYGEECSVTAVEPESLSSPNYWDYLYVNDSNVTCLSIAAGGNTMKVSSMKFYLEKPHEFSNTSIRFGLNNTQFTSELYECILDDYSDSTVKFGVAICKGSTLNYDALKYVDMTIDKDDIGDTTFALVVNNITIFDQDLTACAYVCIDGIYYYSIPKTYSVNSIALKYTSMYENDTTLYNMLTYLAYATYQNK